MSSILWTESQLLAFTGAHIEEKMTALVQLQTCLWQMCPGCVRFISIATLFVPVVGTYASEAPKQDFSPFVTLPIFCADSKPYNDFERPPSNGELASYLVAAMRKNSYRMGDRWFALSLCHLWEGVYPLRSRYEGTFELEDGTLDTPILVLSNTYDPATPLVGAIHANERLRDNARLVQQVDEWGHSTVNQKSFCTAEIVSAYMVDGKVPELKHTLCEVDQKPFKPFDASLVIEEPGVDMELRKAWLESSLA